MTSLDEFIRALAPEVKQSIVFVATRDGNLKDASEEEIERMIEAAFQRLFDRRGQAQ